MPLTRAEHLMAKLAEECAEVTERVLKAMQYGPEEIQPGQPYTNAERVMHEVCDLTAAVKMLVEAGVLPAWTAARESEYDGRVVAKQVKVEEFLNWLAGRGRVSDLAAPPTPHPEA